MVKSQWASLHRVIRLLVAADSRINIFLGTKLFCADSHIKTLRIPLPGHVAPFFEPLEQQRVGAFGQHGVGVPGGQV